MQSLSKFNKRFKYLLCAIDLFSKYAWVIPIKDYIDVLDDIVNKYNKTVHKTIKIKLIDVRVILMLNITKILIKKVLNLKLVTM